MQIDSTQPAHRHAVRRASNLLGTASLGLVAALIAAPASAQSMDETAQEEASGPVIIVSAAKRDQRLEDVPLAVTVLGEDALAARQLTDFREFAAQVPGFNVQSAGAAFNRLILRGQNSGAFGATVATIVDEVPLTYSSAVGNAGFLTSIINTYDVGQVEVLRGPQGTLYGANSLGGLVKYATNAPDPSGFHVGGEVGVENVNQGETRGLVRAFVNAPLAEDKAAIRITGWYEGLPGYIDNALQGRRDVNGGTNKGVRGSLLFTPTETLMIRLTGLVQDYDVDGIGVIDVVGAAITPSNPPANALSPLNGLNYNQRADQGLEINTQFYTGSIKWDLGGVEVTSITGYSKASTRFLRDDSGLLAAPGFTFGQALGLFVYGQPGGVTLARRERDSLEKFSQELRIGSSDSTLFGSKLAWQIGGFYTTEDNTNALFRDARNITTGTLITTPFPPSGATTDARYEEIAIFGDATLSLTDRFDIGLGGRWARNEQRTSIVNIPSFLSGGVASSTRDTSAEDVFTWSVAPSYKITPDTLLYARIASGYNPGGPNTGTSGTPVPDSARAFRSMQTVNYEIGIRSSLFDRTLTLDLAAYRIDWDDIQLNTSIIVPVTPPVALGIVSNGGKARIKGVEYNIAWRPIAGLSFAAVGSYVDSVLTQDQPELGTLKGQRLAYVPKFSNTLNADYAWKVYGDFTAALGASWIHVGARQGDLSPVPTATNHPDIPAYDLVNLQASLGNDNYTITFYAKNLFDERGINFYTSAGGIGPNGIATLVNPRTIGARFAVRF